MQKRKEVLEVWEYLKRFGSQQDRDRFRPVHRYIQDLEKRILLLEGEIHSLKQTETIPKGPSAKNYQIPVPPESNSSTWKPLPPVHAPLAQRLSQMDYLAMRESNEWTITLKWNRLSEERAQELIDEYRLKKSNT